MTLYKTNGRKEIRISFLREKNPLKLGSWAPKGRKLIHFVCSRWCGKQFLRGGGICLTHPICSNDLSLRRNTPRIAHVLSKTTMGI